MKTLLFYAIVFNLILLKVSANSCKTYTLIEDIDVGPCHKISLYGIESKNYHFEAKGNTFFIRPAFFGDSQHLCKKREYKTYAADSETACESKRELFLQHVEEQRNIHCPSINMKRQESKNQASTNCISPNIDKNEWGLAKIKTEE